MYDSSVEERPRTYYSNLLRSTILLTEANTLQLDKYDNLNTRNVGDIVRVVMLEGSTGRPNLNYSGRYMIKTILLNGSTKPSQRLTLVRLGNNIE